MEKTTHQPDASEASIIDRFDALLTASPDAILVIDASGVIRLVNEHAVRLFGRSHQQLIGQRVEALMPERFRHGHPAERDRFIAHGEARPMGKAGGTLYGMRADGSEFPVEISLKPVDVEGTRFVAAAMRDVTLRQANEEKLRQLSAEVERNRASLRAILDSLNEAVLVCSHESGLVDANPAATRMFRLDELRGMRSLSEVAHQYELFDMNGVPLPTTEWPLARIARGEAISDVEVRVRRAGSDASWVASCSGAPIVLAHDRQQTLAVCTVRDITRQKQDQERIERASLHDPLTGLPNRAMLADYSPHILARAERNHDQAAVLFIDLDRFKPINDRHGHETGDAVLRETARRMQDRVRRGDTAFRLGGDEFLIVLPDIPDGSVAGEAARHVIDAIHDPYIVGNLKLSLSASIGISVYPRDGKDVETLVDKADAAMYQAKTDGENRFHFYSSELGRRARAAAHMEGELHAALEHGGFRLEYQPLIELHDLKVSSVEALLRWDWGNVGPEQFIPVAETAGLISELGRWVLDAACRQHEEWLAHGLPPIPVSVNLSAAQLRLPDLPDALSDLLALHHLPPAAVQLELKEAALIDDVERAADQLNRLKTLGIQITLDDFGTGTSSLSHLSALPIDRIKVDKSLVGGIGRDAQCDAVTRAIVALGHAMQLDVIAEGVESEETLQAIRSLGCDKAQGHHLCAPLPPEALETWLRQRPQPAFSGT